MKRIFTFLLFAMLVTAAFAQAPQKLSYQAVIRNTSDQLVTNTTVGMQISILQGSATGTVVYSETQTPTTNANGLVSIEIGNGTGFDAIDWSNGPYFIKTETDITGGTSYTISGTSELLSVPYALHAKTAESVVGGISETDPVFDLSAAATITASDITYWDNKLSTEVDGDVTNELQILSISNDTIRLTNGGFVKLPAGFDGDYNSLIGAPTNVSAFTNDAMYLTSFTEVDGDVTNEIQILSISNDTIRLTNGGFVKLPAGFDGDYNSLINKPTIPVVPTNVSAFTNDAMYLTSFTEVDGSITNELQILSISNDTIRLTNGGFVKLPAGFDGDYNSLINKPTIPVVPTNVGAFTNDVGYLTTFTEVDGSVTNELQILSISNDTIRLTNGGFVKLPAGFDGQYSSLTGVPTNVSSFSNDAGYLTSFTEIDPEVGANSTNYVSKWNGTALVSSGVYDDGTNVGIGTATPAYKLDVTADAQINGVRVGRGGGNQASNVMIGSYALITNSSGFANTAVGFYSLFSNTTGSTNTAIGQHTLYANTIGKWNTALGCQALTNNIDGNSNTALGLQSLGANTTGDNNTAVGRDALLRNSTGNNNVALGQEAGFNGFSGSNNVFLGYQAGYNEAGSNKLYIANSSTSTPLLYGDFSTATLTVYSNLNINNEYTFPNADGTSGQVLSTNGSGVLGWSSLATVATSGSYNDLIDKPLLFDGQYSSLTGAPTNVSSFTNDAGYLTSFTEVDGSITNELQLLSISNDTIFLTDGGFVKLPDNHPGSTLPAVVTVGVSDIVYTGCSADGNVTVSGGELVVSRGIVLASHVNATLSDTVITSGSGSGIFDVQISQLAPSHTYYIRAYATNILGTVYGNELSFTTLALTTPTLTTNDVYNISHTTAMSGGNISDDGGSPLIERGVCWSLSSNPTIADNTDPEGTAVGSYNAMMSGLTPATVYYLRAYATNAQGTAYGNELSFTTSTLSLASITTSAPGAVSYTTATSGGNVTADNGSSVTSRGICWATTSGPTTANSVYSEAGGLGSFTADMTGLSPSTTYYVRAFAINGAGTVYGNEYNFTTAALTAPVLTTKSINGISSNIAASGGNITTDGGSNITAKGVCWSLNTAPSLLDNYTSDGTGTASFNSTMTGLNPLTMYYVRAYATNATGTAYGNELIFTTTDLVFPGPSVPTVGTSTSSITGSSTASSGGYVSSDGGSAVTVRGLCWSTNQNPTLSDNYSTDGGTGVGYFSSTITGLSGCGNVYYVRAYATNSTGTGYGNQNTVSTGLLPIVTTDDISGIEYYAAISGGSITDNGGCAIIQKGVCWSYYPDPTIGNNHTSEGAGNDPYVSNISGLDPNRTYYVRSYATNSVGTSYGDQKVFVTATPPTPYIGQNYAGGIVFYIDSTGNHGLVCAPSDQGYLSWGCQGVFVSGTGTSVGTGQVNTAAIVATCSESNIAAKACDNLVLNGYDDWFLPSVDELSLMCSYLHGHGLGNFINYCYWSSSDFNAYSAMGFYFNGCYQQTSPKDVNMKYYVRAVRAF